MELHRRIALAVTLLLVVILLGTVGYVALLGATWVDAFYMTVITISTVGFSEVVPGLETSPEGRIFTVVLILFGTGILLYVLGSLTALFVEGELTDILRKKKMEKTIEKMRDHIVVCGIGTTGVHVVEELASVGERFVAIERDREKIDRALERFSFPYIEGDSTQDDVLWSAGIQHARGIVSLLPTDKDNLYVAFTARQMNPGIRIVARGVDDANRRKCQRAGADSVVYPNKIGGLRMVSELIRPQAVSFLDRMLRPGEEIWRISEVAISSGSGAAGKTLDSLRIGERVGVPVLALTEDEGKKVVYYPGGDTVLTDRQSLVVLGEKSHLDKLRDVVRNG